MKPNYERSTYQPERNSVAGKLHRLIYRALLFALSAIAVGLVVFGIINIIKFEL
jgi:hypothetical protein